MTSEEHGKAIAVGAIIAGLEPVVMEWQSICRYGPEGYNKFEPEEVSVFTQTEKDSSCAAVYILTRLRILLSKW